MAFSARVAAVLWRLGGTGRGGTSGLPGGLEGSRWLVFASKSVTGFGGDIDGAARELVDGSRRRETWDPQSKTSFAPGSDAVCS